MEPNQGMVGAQGVNSATSAGAPVNVAPESPKKKSNAMALGMILLAIIAAGGIGFGVWAILDGNAQKEQLSAQIDDLKIQNSELLDKLGNTDDSEDVIVNVNTSDYIYVGEWGYKIKIPEDLGGISYAIRQSNDGYAGLSDYIRLSISGMKGYDGSLLDFADMYKNTSGLLTMIRVPIGTEMPLGSPPSLIFSDEEYDYYYFHPQAVYSVEENEKGLEVESVNAIQDMITNTANWATI